MEGKFQEHAIELAEGKFQEQIQAITILFRGNAILLNIAYQTLNLSTDEFKKVL